MCYAGMNTEALDALIDSQNEKFTERRLREFRGGDPRDPDWCGHWLDEEEEENANDQPSQTND